MSKIPEITDINPKTWLRPFQKNSTAYLLKMALFYQGLALGLWYIGSSAASVAMSDYTPPQFPVSVLLALAAGTFEETIFFGIPYYVTTNPYVVLASASVWSFAHLFSTHAISISSLAYGNFLLSIPYMFFSLRTWTSGKGWFAIVFHSAWNISMLLAYCGMGIRTCTLIGTGDNMMTDVLTVAAGTSAVLFVYQIYKNRTQKVNRRVTILILAVLAASTVMMSVMNISFLF